MMPNGELARNEVADQTAAAEQYYAMVSPLRDMLGMTEPKQATPTVAIFDAQIKADVLLKQLRAKATAVGVDNWGGAVVSRICSPFTADDPSVTFAEQVCQWARENGGQ